MIKDNSFRHSIEPNNPFEVELNNVASIIRLVARDKVSHIKESVYNHHDCIASCLSSKGSNNEVHTHVIPTPNRYE